MSFECDICGATFPCKHNLKRHKTRMHIPKECIQCGEMFTKYESGNVLLCSDECQRKRTNYRVRRNRKKVVHSNTCQMCGKETRSSRVSKFCSDKCRNEQYNEKRRQKTLTEKEKLRCITCGNKLPKYRTKFCSDKCLENHPKTKLKKVMARRMRDVLKENSVEKSHSTFSLCGFTVMELHKHLESQFTDGMSWDNMGEWHIDHIRPVKSFNFISTECEDFKKCWALNNLQPLWAKDNLSKGNKWDGVVNA